MIKYSLACPGGHEFEAWFRDSAGYEAQAARSEIACPCCGATDVTKAIMAPAIATRSERSSRLRSEDQPQREQMYALMHRLREAVQTSAEYVGHDFPEEARRIHHSEAPDRGIYGEATLEEAKALTDEGIPILPLPRLRGDLN